MAPTLGKTLDGKALAIDVERLVVSRALIQANSGAGKSWAVRRLLEQTNGKVQQIVLDVEGEFYTLREKFDLILARAGEKDRRDCAAYPGNAAMLARKLLELHHSAVVDIFELKPPERFRFAKLFLDALMNSPRELWHPCLVVVDEAHMFCPEKTGAESRDAVIDLMARGRKRGFCGVLATQRLSKLAKDAAAEANNKIIGRAALDVDMERAGDELGFSKEGRKVLRTIEPGHFFAFGPALSPAVVEILVGPVETTHPEPGQKAAPVPAPKAKVQKVLGQLADLPKEAEEEARTLADAKATIRNLQRDLREAQKGAPKSDPAAIEKAVERERAHFQHVLDKTYGDVKGRDARIVAALGKVTELLSRPMNGVELPKLPNLPASPRELAPRAAPVARNVPASPRPRREPVEPAGDLTGPEQRILDAIAWLESIGVDGPEQTAVAFLAGYTYGGGAFNNPRGRLNVKGLVEYLPGERIRLTDEGRGLARAPDAPLTPDELHAKVLEVLPGPEQRLLKPLLAAYPDGLSNEDLAAAAGYGAGGGAYNNPRGRLRSLGLIEYVNGEVRARDILFPGMG